jgi:hypothetical protein
MINNTFKSIEFIAFLLAHTGIPPRNLVQAYKHENVRSFPIIPPEM